MSNQPNDDRDERVTAETAEIEQEIAAAQRQLADHERRKRDARREYQRAYFAAHREEYLDYQRRYRAAQREADPERYREMRNARTRRWRDKHRDEQNAKLRAKYRDGAPAIREKRKAYYAANKEKMREKAREYREQNREKVAAAHTAWARRERHRRKEGLPPHRHRTVTRAEREENLAAADAFFSRHRTRAEVDKERHVQQTPPELISALARDNARARAVYRLHEKKDELARARIALARRHLTPTPADQPAAARAAEEARMDAIGREINDRYRHHPRHTPSALDGDPAAPHPMLTHPAQTGLHR